MDWDWIMLEFGQLLSYPILPSLCVAFHLHVLNEPKSEHPWNSCGLPEVQYLHLFSTHWSVCSLKAKTRSCTEMCAVSSGYLAVPVEACSIQPKLFTMQCKFYKQLLREHFLCNDVTGQSEEALCAVSYSFGFHLKT